MTTEVIAKQEFLEQAEHTLLKPDATWNDLENFLVDADGIGVTRVCISPTFVSQARTWINENLKTPLSLVTVVGFPSGAHEAEIKAQEANTAVTNGADEIDMVINRANIESEDALTDEIRTVKEACGKAALKVIFETAALNDEQIVRACRAATRAGADFVKTSTGFDPAGGASVHAVELMRNNISAAMGVKASGGIRTPEAVRELAAAGATRFGVSGTAQITENWT